ncbi:hypothetical protein [Dyadobacter luticola]|uniref:Outer membrane protein beta-barrel domain-containing protein n=1 Tax=Dyadobacter luticola TaxID=1979387 RepID=A0A5R9KPI1_9BACT|nr:hypothetical protein [Dyadobacter luticola]TLU98077.1 hypothetical protein FEN17_25160 [Dyadobacter luticola]
MKKVLLGCVFLAAIHPAFGQNQSNVNAGIDVGTGFKNSAWAPSLLYHEEVGIGKLSWLRLGLGLRAWAYYGEGATLSSKDESNNLLFRKTSVNGASFVAGFNFCFPRVDIGINTDIGGLALGSKRSGFYEKTTSTPGIGELFYNTWLSTSPVNFDFLPLFLKNYNGQSEIYARIYLSKKMGLKLGYVLGQIAYKTNNVKERKVLLDDRERRVFDRYSLPYAALSFSLSD